MSEDPHPTPHQFASPAEPPAAVPDPSPPTTWVEGSGTAADLWASWCECERRDLVQKPVRRQDFSILDESRNDAGGTYFNFNWKLGSPAMITGE